MLEIIAFCCGALVMVLEMVGARVLATHVGTSAVVWTSLIGVVLACLALGAWLGGRRADRHLSRRGLALILLGASLGSALAAGTHRLVGGALSAAITDIHLAAVACALGILALPALCCGMISPYIIRLRIRDVATSGATVGRLYALSTAGSIAGTFLGGFVLISFFASGTILWGVALGLLLLSLPAEPSRPWGRLALLCLLLLELTLGHIALVDPHLDTDAAVGGLGLEEAIVDESAERLQRDAAFTVELRTAHFRTAETAGELDTNTLGACTHGILLSLTHRATEGHAVGELLGDALSDELGVDGRVLHFEDVELNLLAGELLELGTNTLGFGATTADHDARTGGVDVHTHAVAGALDDDAGHARTLEILVHDLADGVIFEDEVTITLADLVGIGEPLGTMALSNAQAIAKGINLLTHL